MASPRADAAPAAWSERYRGTLHSFWAGELFFPTMFTCYACDQEKSPNKTESTNACNPVDKPTGNNGEDRLIDPLKTQRCSPNQHGHGSSNLPLFIFPEEYWKQHVPQLGNALLEHLFYFLKDLSFVTWGTRPSSICSLLHSHMGPKEYP